MLTMEKFAERLDISPSKLYKLINSFDDSKSILKGTIKMGKNRKISSWKVDELIQQTKQYLEGEQIESKNFTKQIAFNVIPHIDVFADDGYTKEELKMTNETKKILDESIELTATCVRIPVLVSHSESVNCLLYTSPRPRDKRQSRMPASA